MQYGILDSRDYGLKPSRDVRIKEFNCLFLVPLEKCDEDFPMFFLRPRSCCRMHGNPP